MCISATAFIKHAHSLSEISWTCFSFSNLQWKLWWWMQQYFCKSDAVYDAGGCQITPDIVFWSSWQNNVHIGTKFILHNAHESYAQLLIIHFAPWSCWVTYVIMVALFNRADHYIFALWFLSVFFFFFYSSPNLSGRRLDVYHTSTHGVALVHVWNVLHVARWKYRTQKWCKNSPSVHHPTTLSGYIFATKARIDNCKKNLLSSNTSSTSLQYGELRPSSGWDPFVSLGHPS